MLTALWANWRLSPEHLNAPAGLSTAELVGPPRFDELFGESSEEARPGVLPKGRHAVYRWLIYPPHWAIGQRYLAYVGQVYRRDQPPRVRLQEHLNDFIRPGWRGELARWAPEIDPPAVEGAERIRTDRVNRVSLFLHGGNALVPPDQRGVVYMSILLEVDICREVDYEYKRVLGSYRVNEDTKQDLLDMAEAAAIQEFKAPHVRPMTGELLDPAQPEQSAFFAYPPSPQVFNIRQELGRLPARLLAEARVPTLIHLQPPEGFYAPCPVHWPPSS
jgi:hypothetical protein